MNSVYSFAKSRLGSNFITPEEVQAAHKAVDPSFEYGAHTLQHIQKYIPADKYLSTLSSVNNIVIPRAPYSMELGEVLQLAGESIVFEKCLDIYDESVVTNIDWMVVKRYVPSNPVLPISVQAMGDHRLEPMNLTDTLYAVLTYLRVTNSLPFTRDLIVETEDPRFRKLLVSYSGSNKSDAKIYVKKFDSNALMEQVGKIFPPMVQKSMAVYLRC